LCSVKNRGRQCVVLLMGVSENVQKLRTWKCMLIWKKRASGCSLFAASRNTTFVFFLLFKKARGLKKNLQVATLFYLTAVNKRLNLKSKFFSGMCVCACVRARARPTCANLPPYRLIINKNIQTQKKPAKSENLHAWFSVCFIAARNSCNVFRYLHINLFEQASPFVATLSLLNGTPIPSVLVPALV
jgi:hypothetical protein